MKCGCARGWGGARAIREKSLQINMPAFAPDIYRSARARVFAQHLCAASAHRICMRMRCTFNFNCFVLNACAAAAAAPHKRKWESRWGAHTHSPVTEPNALCVRCCRCSRWALHARTHAFIPIRGQRAAQRSSRKTKKTTHTVCVFVWVGVSSLLLLRISSGLNAPAPESGPDAKSRNWFQRQSALYA